MKIKLYNTLSRKKEEFRPINNGTVKMYVCGPTVYDVPHIGHARSSFVFDVIRRYFEYRGFDVYFIRNVTDVDDKIINKAAGELVKEECGAEGGGLKEKVAEVASKYLDVYRNQMKELGIRPPDVEPKATEQIDDMIKFIETLISKEYAYVSGGNVYFSVDKFAEYGKLSGQDKDQMMHGARVDTDEHKRHQLDFALWKEAKPEEPSWKSPWGEGRPGWHIECSVMSTNILGPQFDIHGGGLDLIFPHHENEIAQAEAATGCSFANYWIHNGLLTVNGEKMSKSLGNYITISDFLEKHGDPDLLKIAFLNSHYRSPVDYSDEKIDESKSARQRIMIFLEKADRLISRFPSAAPKNKEADVFREKFESAMDDDFNTPVALSVIFEAVRAGNERLSVEKAGEEDALMAASLKGFILEAAGVLGLSLSSEGIDESEAGRIEKLIAEREKARKNKDYSAADDIRKKLNDMGVTIEDMPEGTVWRKI